MSTYDVPGQNNIDELRMGCWAENADGSLIFVYSNENGSVVYSIFDLSKNPVLEYRDAMDEPSFKDLFSWTGAVQQGRDAQGRLMQKDKWLWHDKTPFPWDRVIRAGAQDGPKYASAYDQISAAQKVANDLKLRANKFDPKDHEHMAERTEDRVGGIRNRLKRAFSELVN